MIFGVKVKVAQTHRQTKTYLSVGLICMLLSLCFHMFGSFYESQLAAQLAIKSIRNAAALEMQAWIRTCSTSSFICLWIAVMTLFQVAFQHRKTLKTA
ncbi:MAG: hypothetical protein JWM68_742 [Verrucomicrobiales bacterium]|nr:hypothetical protein [Verrucomicrobiales bacterium]